MADDARQPVGRAVVGGEPALDEYRSHARRFPEEAHVATEREAEARPDRGAVDRRDDRHVAARERLGQLAGEPPAVDPVMARGVPALLRGKVAEVRARAEAAALAGDHQCVHLVALVGLGDSVEQQLDGVSVEGVHRLRPVEAREQHAVLDRGEQRRLSRVVGRIRRPCHHLATPYLVGRLGEVCATASRDAIGYAHAARREPA